MAILGVHTKEPGANAGANTLLYSALRPAVLKGNPRMASFMLHQFSGIKMALGIGPCADV